MTNKEKLIKIGLEEWKLLHRIISHFVDNYAIKFSNGHIVQIIFKNVKEEEVIQWTKKSLKS